MHEFLKYAFMRLSAALILSLIVGAPTHAAPYAAIVQDARTGQIIYEQNADTRLHPASLTKMLTLYIAFEELRRGGITLDEKVTISPNAAAEPPSKIGLRAGQKIAFRYLIRAAAIKSANDAATAIGEAISGSEADFARRMTRTAKALGMKSSSFKNAHGLTAAGHMSTAQDMNTLGRRLFYDFPEYYNIFSRLEDHAGIRNVQNTNRRFLSGYKGADGIKTGYTSNAGYNLTASAERGNTRIIATIFGGKSTAHRNAKMADLLDIGFKKAPKNAPDRLPPPVNYEQNIATLPPQPRPAGLVGAAPVAQTASAPNTAITAALEIALEAPSAPPTRPFEAAPSQEDAIAQSSLFATGISPPPQILTTPPPRAPIFKAIQADIPDFPSENAVITLAPSDERNRGWAIHLGVFATKDAAQRTLLKTTMGYGAALSDGTPDINKKNNGYNAQITQLTRRQAEVACRTLTASKETCFIIGPADQS